MDIKFDDYLAKGTEKILEVFSAADISDEEKEVIVSSFSEELMRNIADTSKLQDYEYEIYSVSLKFLDEKISGTISNAQASYGEYENAIKYCARVKDILQIFSLKKWSMPKLRNADIDECEQIIKKKQESTSISSKIIEEDCRIDEQIRIAQNELSVNACDTVIELLDELANDLALCKQKRISVPTVNNKETKKIAKKVAEIRKIAEQKESLNQAMYDLDLQIHNIISMSQTSSEQWQEVLTLCQRQIAFISDCNKKQWPMPSLRCLNVNELITKYNHYLHMNALDKSISSNRALLTSGKQYKTFFDNCTQLANCIDTCTKNDWSIPDLIISDPLGISDEVREEKKKKDRVKKINQNIALGTAGVIAVMIFVIFCVAKYREGKIQIPFDSNYVYGEQLSLIYDELDDAGFENIQKVADNSGWLDSDEVISVSIDNQDSYGKDSHKKPDVSVVITYSSPGRIYVTDLLKDWKNTEYKEVVDKLKVAGFTNIIVNELDTAEKDLDQLTASVELDGLSYTNEHCYLPTNAPIVITYYVLKIGIGNDSAQFIGQDYEDVIANLEESGFTNVQTEVINTGWAEGNTVISVNVNNTDNYDSNASFSPDVRIVVKYSSNDRTDITTALDGWSTKQYTALQASFRSNGFTNVTFKEKVTDNKPLNLQAASISINGQKYSQGDCFVQKSAPIVVEYYRLKITIGNKTSYFTENKAGNYSSIVSSLKSMGFTNISLYRNNDLFNGWMTKEGSIESITINGSDSFEADESFYYDAPIEIIVNTFKGKGCEDITLVAD